MAARAHWFEDDASASGFEDEAPAATDEKSGEDAPADGTQ